MPSLGPFACVGYTLLVAQSVATPLPQTQEAADAASRLVRSMREGKGQSTMATRADKDVPRNGPIESRSSPILCISRAAQLSKEAKIAGVTARVLVTVTVEKDGTVHPIRALSKVGFGLDAEALDAV